VFITPHLADSLSTELLCMVGCDVDSEMLTGLARHEHDASGTRCP
jgi:hypothetical protein